MRNSYLIPPTGSLAVTCMIMACEVKVGKKLTEEGKKEYQVKLAKQEYEKKMRKKERKKIFFLICF